MKKRSLKKGFTLVELVVVIAVVAILAAVSVGAYFGITATANLSAAKQHIKQMNDMLTYEYIMEGAHNKTFHEARRDVQRQGLDVTKLKEFSSLKYGWDYESDQFVLVDMDSKTEDGSYSIVAPNETILTNPRSIFLIANNLEDLNGDFSYYLNDTFKFEDENFKSISGINGNGVKGGIDTGLVQVDEIVYSNNLDTKIIFNTTFYDTKLIITAGNNGNIHHYGFSHEVIIHSVGPNSYHEFGTVGHLTIESGKIDIEAGSRVFILNTENDSTIGKQNGRNEININGINNSCSTGGHVAVNSTVFPDLLNVYRVCNYCGNTLNYAGNELTDEQPKNMGYLKYHLDTTTYDDSCNHESFENAPGKPGEANSVSCDHCSFHFFTTSEVHHYVLEMKPIMDEEGNILSEELIPTYVCDCGCGNWTQQLQANVRQLSDDEVISILYNDEGKVSLGTPEDIKDPWGFLGSTHYVEAVDCGYEFSSVDVELNTDNGIIGSWESSPYKDWICDFVISFDRDVKAGSVGIWGQFDEFPIPLAFTIPLNLENGRMIPLLTTISIAAGVEFMMPYSTIASDVKTFNCGAINLSEEHEGSDGISPTKVTVELVAINPSIITSQEFGQIISSEDPDFTPFLGNEQFRDDENMFQLVTAFDYYLGEAKTIFDSEDGSVCDCNLYQSQPVEGQN